MITVIQKPLTFAEFLAWDDGTGRDFELINGLPMPISEPNAIAQARSLSVFGLTV